ncbi:MULTISPECIES: CAAD domain-containing protein [unclassified Cyanobium]|uniref:CAAD domain-containing protein n=1 Tax=unclassified Cyanobium TaxID=2627006 RepID=UPI0020CD7005|nr:MULTISPECIES: CAAD domain-containing protein [unclassified Cyanobium]MCP9777194.1 hypothetical protein [Cyanobium sp. Tous-M-B4]MCP9877957.1 hypothetical protein [Cyanobium sp. A2C-AMD]
MADDTTINPDTDPASPSQEVEAVQQSTEQTAPQAVEQPTPQPFEEIVEQPTPQAAPPEPSIAATLVIEAEPQNGEGGEWELLLGKLRQWLDQNELNNLWAQARKPVTILAGLVGLLLVLRVYSAVLGALDSLPLVPGLLELVGVVWAVRYGIPKLLRSSERERLLGGLQQSWKAFRGKD